MKKANYLTTAILFILVILSGCKNATNTTSTNPQMTEISSDEKESTKKEISGRIDEIIKGVKELNVDVALKPYSSDPSFRIVNTDASVTDYQTMKNGQTEVFRTVKSISFTTIKEDFQFLSKDLVICTWTGRNEFELKTGEKMKIDPYAGSMLFSKKNNEWKIIYAHESSAQPVKVEFKK